MYISISFYINLYPEETLNVCNTVSCDMCLPC